MTRDDIIRMAQQTGWDFGWEMTVEQVCEFANLVAAAEREAIAKMIDDAPPLVHFAKNEHDGCLICGFTPKLAAFTIRERMRHE